MIKLIPILSLYVLCLAGCDDYSEKAIIEDYVVGAPYEVLKVDGNEPKRIPHGIFVTYVPYVYVDQGKHELSLQRRDRPFDSKDNPVVKIQIEVSGGKRYRIFEMNNEPVIKEDHSIENQKVDRSQDGSINSVTLRFTP
jgi:hypothetical protein